MITCGRSAGSGTMGYSKIIPEAVKGLFKTRLSISMDDVDKASSSPVFQGRTPQDRQKTGRQARSKVADNLHEVCGETGAAHPLVMLVSGPGNRPNPATASCSCRFRPGVRRPLFPGDGRHQRNCPRAEGIDGSLAKQVDYGQLPEIPEIPGSDQDRNGHPRRGPHPDGHDRVVAQTAHDDSGWWAAGATECGTRPSFRKRIFASTLLTARRCTPRRTTSSRTNRPP